MGMGTLGTSREDSAADGGVELVPECGCVTWMVWSVTRVAVFVSTPGVRRCDNVSFVCVA